MKYFLVTYELLDGLHEHTGAIIFAAETAAEACKMAETEEFDPATDSPAFYFSYGGDGMTACKNTGCQEISKEEMEFLERVRLAYKK
jgi:hypothetical protein